MYKRIICVFLIIVLLFVTTVPTYAIAAEAIIGASALTTFALSLMSWQIKDPESYNDAVEGAYRSFVNFKNATLPAISQECQAFFSSFYTDYEPCQAAADTYGKDSVEYSNALKAAGFISADGKRVSARFASVLTNSLAWGVRQRNFETCLISGDFERMAANIDYINWTDDFPNPFNYAYRYYIARPHQYDSVLDVSVMSPTNSELFFSYADDDTFVYAEYNAGNYLYFMVSPEPHFTYSDDGKTFTVPFNHCLQNGIACDGLSNPHSYYSTYKTGFYIDFSKPFYLDSNSNHYYWDGLGLKLNDEYLYSADVPASDAGIFIPENDSVTNALIGGQTVGFVGSDYVADSDGSITDVGTIPIDNPKVGSAPFTDVGSVPTTSTLSLDGASISDAISSGTLTDVTFGNYFSSLFDSIGSLFSFVDNVFNYIIDGQIPKIPIHLSQAESKYDWGNDTYILDMTWFVRYKPYTDTILSAILWCLFLWRLWHNLPNVFNGVPTEVVNNGKKGSVK